MLANRIPKELQARLEGNAFRRLNRYVPWGNQNVLAETFCKVCGTTVTAMGPDPRFAPRRRELKDTEVRTVILETMVSRLRTPYFDTIEFEMTEAREEYVPTAQETRDDFPDLIGVHCTTICTGCKRNILDGKHDLEEVQALYEADLEQIAEADEVRGVPEAHTLKALTWMARRKVTKVLG